MNAARSASVLPLPSMPFASHITKRMSIVGTVVGLHVLGLWAMQSGLLSRAVELVIPVQVIADIIEAPQPEITPAPPSPVPTPQPVINKPRPVVRPPPPRVPQPMVEPLPRTDAAAAITAPVLMPEISQAPASESSPAQAVVKAEPAAARIELPSSDADYLSNPAPAYPALSRRLGEQGKVVVRVFIEASGSATRAEIGSSSGYERLDQTALQTVQRWRYVPGKRNGVPEAMWFNVPITFVLE
ncbi:energy transducer TonB [Hydrogenophaga sp.]|uniref:energy transducer TonB n=1 Tax=Hydrogenophaga sp. TaxID=1904254 RepID=UPI00271E35C3|nr:energy transducer TonB [Hydrogenophaga sp.]MDO8904709.1 energy transducer TonB [Hydrogenophaga sp.]